MTHVTSTEAYLTECGVFETCSFDALQDTCAYYEDFGIFTQFGAYLKDVTAGNTSGKVFVATYQQMNGGFSFFQDPDMRLGYTEYGQLMSYWTSSETYGSNARIVDTTGNFTTSSKSSALGCRLSICIDLTEL